MIKCNKSPNKKFKADTRSSQLIVMWIAHWATFVKCKNPKHCSAQSELGLFYKS